MNIVVEHYTAFSLWCNVAKASISSQQVRLYRQSACAVHALRGWPHSPRTSRL